jgi:multisubunit Na+/H+ antiporter MnhC subunit
MNASKIAILLAHPFVGWALCFATIGIGMAVTTQQAALIVHAVAAPIFFAAISWFYYSRFHYTRPLPTAVIFTAFVIAMDFFVVSLLLLHNTEEMFTSLLGTWIPFMLIFLSTYLTGLFVNRPKPQ